MVAIMPRPRLRPIIFNPWAGRLQEAAAYLRELPRLDVSKFTSRPDDAHLAKLGRLDADWHGESTRCLASLQHEALDFLPALVLGRTGFAELVGATIPRDEHWCFIIYGQQPQSLDKLAGPVFEALRKRGMVVAYYAFDEASRTMPCFKAIAPNIDLLIHDESPMEAESKALLSAQCRCVHRSWVANLLPQASPFNESPEEHIVFLGSEMGLTDNRRRQVAHLKAHFGERFTAYHDHSVSVAERTLLSRFKVSLCPEGRKFNSPAMAQTHTDRPFWSGCLGMVPVSEDSKEGGRLETLAQEGLILRYRQGDLEDLVRVCEKALALSTQERRRIYDRFNREQTVGGVVAEEIACTLLK